MKRLFDLVIASVGLMRVSPILILVAGLVRVSSPILLRQKRPGPHGQLFEILKFRTMTNERDASGNLLPPAERITHVGRFLRSTSIDELPELINVIKGDMSLVGPRPLLPAYLELYSSFHSRRHEVRPGITGWAQVKGHNLLSWEERFELDVWYVDNATIWLDLKIFLMTVLAVVKREGISPVGSVIMHPFKGTNDRRT